MMVRCGIVHRGQHARRHLALAHVEPAVDRGDDEVEPREHRVVEVDAAVLQDVGLDALEDPDALEPPVHLVDLVRLAGQIVGPESAGVRGGLAVVGDADVPVARVAACSASSSTVFEPSEYRVWQCSRPWRSQRSTSAAAGARGGRHLALAFAQLGLDEVQSERGVEAPLVGGGTKACPARAPRR